MRRVDDLVSSAKTTENTSIHSSYPSVRYFMQMKQSNYKITEKLIL